MRRTQPFKIACFATGMALFLCTLNMAHAGTATSITGLYATGMAGATRDTNWDIVGKTNGAYVVTSTAIPGVWMPSPTAAKWISYSSNALPAAPNPPATTYAYTLTFTIAGTGNNGDAVDNVSITLTLAADDSATVSVNGLATGLSATGYAATTTLVLNSSNSNFKQGTNTLTLYVANSGVYQTGLLVSSITGVVPEVGTWIPVLGALTLVGWMRLRPKKTPAINHRLTRL